MPSTRRKMTDDHEERLADGRAASQVVRRYLEALDATRPRRGRQPSVDALHARLDDVAERLEGAGALPRLLLLQERRELQRRLETATQSGADVSELEADFVKVAKEYGERKGVEYSSWVDAGVSPVVLTRAGIARSR